MLNEILNNNLNDWEHILKDEFQKEYFIKIMDFLAQEYNSKTIYPPANEVFNALSFTSFKDTKVVILGQDPYHGSGQAHGLSFSVNPDVKKIPPSLKNIYKELTSDLGVFIPNNGYLADWAKQGVLLLNTTLTVQEANPNSHEKIGWSIFTNRIIELLNQKDSPVVFILWGKNAISKAPLISNPNHLVLTSVHPSPLSAGRGFFGSRPFSKTNKFLRQNNLAEIDWQILNVANIDNM